MGSEVSVASVVYNLAGAEADRPRYLQTVMIRKAFNRGKESMAEMVKNGLLNGPAIKLRSFYRWAALAGNYDEIGLPTGSIQTSGDEIDFALVEAAIPHDLGVTVTVSAAQLTQAQAIYWAERWVADNRPSDLASDWQCSIDTDGDFITITFPVGTPDPLIEVIPVTSPTFNTTSWYIYARYTLSDSPTVERVFIYAIGSGDATLDALVSSTASYGDFYPFIPIRLENEFLSSTHLSTAFEQTTKAYKRAMNGADINELVAALEDNEDLDQIDHAYVVFGVSLNVVENECRKYLYTFFDSLRAAQIGGPSTTSTANQNLITIKGTTSVSDKYNIRLEWRYVNSVTDVIGLGKVDAEVGDLWFTKNGTVGSGSATYEKIRLYWQRTDSTYDYLEIVGLVHHNYVYGTTEVRTKAHEALDATRESGFIIPLHYDIYRHTPLKSSSQMATACMFIVFNCYEVYETPWWDSWFFKIFLVVVVAVVSVATGGLGGVGLLGANLALGGALGFTGLTAAIVGAVVNALAAMVLTSLLEPLLRQVAGPLAPVIMAVLMFAIGSASASMTNTGSFAVNWGDLLKVDNLLALTSAVGQGIAIGIQDDTLSITQQEFDYLQKAELETKKIQQAYFEKFGYGAATIDPLLLVDSLKAPTAESSDTFLTRTLMTGSEIAEMSRELLYEFPTYSLKLPDAFT